MAFRGVLRINKPAKNVLEYLGVKKYKMDVSLLRTQALFLCILTVQTTWDRQSPWPSPAKCAVCGQSRFGCEAWTRAAEPLAGKAAAKLLGVRQHADGHSAAGGAHLHLRR